MSAKFRLFIIRTCKSKIIIIAAALLGLYTLTGFFLAPYLIERFLPNMLNQRLQSQVSLGEVKINPFALTLEAREFHISEPSGETMAGFRRFFVNFQVSSIFRWALTFSEVAMDGPSVNVVIDSKGRINLSRLAGETPAPPSDNEEKSTPLRMLLRNIMFSDGEINVTDTRQSIPATVTLNPLNIQMTDISTLPEGKGRYTLSADINDGTTMHWSGSISLLPLRSEGSLKIRHIPLTIPWNFVRSRLNIAPPEGHLSLESQYILDIDGDTEILMLDDFGADLVDVGIQIKEAEENLLNLPGINLNIGKVDIIQRKIDDVRLVIRGGKLNLIKEKDGALNVQHIAGVGKDPIPLPSTPSGDSEAPWVISMSKFSLEGLALNYTDQSITPAVLFSIDESLLAFKAAISTDLPNAKVHIDDFGITLRQIALGFDDAPQPVFQLGNLTMAGAFDLGTRNASISSLQMTEGIIDVIRNNDNSINIAHLFDTKNPAPDISSKEPPAEKRDTWRFIAERISLSESKARFTDLGVNPDGPVIDLDKINLTVSNFDGKSPSPFEISLQVAQGGRLTVSGNFEPSVAQVKSTITLDDLALSTVQPYVSSIAELTINSGLLSTRGSFNRTAKGDMTYKGQLGISNLQIIDNSTNDTLLGWQRFEAPELRVGLSPKALEIDTIKLSGLSGKLFIAEDKTVNVVSAFRTKDKPSTEPQKKPDPEAPGAVLPVRIGKLVVDKGLLAFSDLSLRPQFATRIHELKGVVIGISSSPGARTQIDLNGRVDEYGSSRIKGEISAYAPEEFTDITMTFRNLEMTNMTPYSGKFAGRRIDTGKLSLDLQYKIENSKLLGNNKIVINSLKLGEKVESPDAVSLPLDLAVALLEDSRGVIDIDLPVSGNLDDPEFAYGALIWKAIVNLLTKIVTSPFRALGALFGDGEETLKAVVFEPGSSSIPPPEEEKLIKLRDALIQRPQLKLTVTGRYQSDSDGQAIRNLKARRALAEISGKSLEPGEEPDPVDFSNPDSQQKLARLFADRYGQEAYDAMLVEITPRDKSAESKDAPKDPGEIAKLMFSEIVKREPVNPNLLKQLAYDRAQSIAGQMSGSDGIPPDRIVIRPPEESTDDSEESISSTLGLDAITSETEE